MDRQLHRDKEGRGQERESKEPKNGMTWVCSLRKLVMDKITEKNGVSCDPKGRKKKWGMGRKWRGPQRVHTSKFIGGR